MFQRSFSRNRSFHRRWNRSKGQTRRHARIAVNPSIQSSKYIHKPEVQSSTERYTAVHRFSDFSIHQIIKDNIAAHGYQTPTPIQDQVIPHILNGRDVVGIASTGTGKTAAFLIPLIHKIISHHAEKILIMVPTRELAVQIDDEFKAFTRSLNLFSLLCIGGVSIGRQIADLRRHPNVVIGTPGRLKDLLQRRQLQLSQFRTVVLDEVDRMVDIGFIRDIRAIIALLPPVRQSLFFSATVSTEIHGVIQAFLKSPVTISVKVEETAQRIQQDVIRVKSKEEKITKLHDMLRQEEFKKVLIFGRTKWGVEKLSTALRQNGFLVASIHGNKSQNQRLQALSQFKQDRLQVLVATDIAARGLDIDDVSHVINFDEPQSYTDYVHRIGRTGRAQKVGKALTFVF